jgi:hypothetical protein|tara:strand:+ start:9690 stop:10583 length:894 start_codon:yes stop_codon:yes gene_type:complete
MKTKTFTINVDDKDKEFLIQTPSLEQQREAQKVYNQAFTDAIKSKSVVRAKLDDLLKDQGLWDDEKQAQFDTLQREISDGEKRLAKGGFGLKEARTLAVKMRQLRDDMRDLISVRTSLDNHSAEGQADNARFNYLVSVCVVYNDSKQPYFSSMEDYLNRSTDPVGLLGAQNLANMMYGLDNDYERNLPENKFLQKYKFIDNDLRYVDKQGRLIDADGRLINEEGRYINDDGKFVDKFGNLIDDEGDYVVESEPFLDDEGNPVILDETPQEDKDQDEEAEASEKPTTPKRKKTASTKS